MLRKQTDGNRPKIDPKIRLQSWLYGKNLSKFSLLEVYSKKDQTL